MSKSNFTAEDEQLLQTPQKHLAYSSSTNEERENQSLHRQKSDPLLDYDTLMTIALERASLDTRNRIRRRNLCYVFTISFAIAACLVMIGVSVLVQKPEENHLKNEIKELNGTIGELNEEVEDFQKINDQDGNFDNLNITGGSRLFLR